MDIPKIPKIDDFKPEQSHLKFCPLCTQPWKIYEEMDTPQRKGDIYLFCLEDEVSIKISDPMLGRWAVIQKEPCPVCGEKEMRLFFRSDEYIKMLCPKCKCCVENVDNEKHAALLKKEEMRGTRKTIKAQKPPEIQQ